jgi:hypothetical protein
MGHKYHLHPAVPAPRRVLCSFQPGSVMLLSSCPPKWRHSRTAELRLRMPRVHAGAFGDVGKTLCNREEWKVTLPCHDIIDIGGVKCTSIADFRLGDRYPHARGCVHLCTYYHPQNAITIRSLPRACGPPCRRGGANADEKDGNAGGR